MPTSHPEGKQWVYNKFKKLKNIRTVLDVGVGLGTYSKLYKYLFPKSIWIGVEIWLPYLKKYNLFKLYDLIIIADIWKMHPIHGLDLVIFGDILEHMEKKKALQVYNRFKQYNKNILISLPIKRFEQGPLEGNPYEEHKAHWSHKEILNNFKGITQNFVGKKKGCYLITKGAK